VKEPDKYLYRFVSREWMLLNKVGRRFRNGVASSIGIATSNEKVSLYVELQFSLKRRVTISIPKIANCITLSVEIKGIKQELL